MFQLDTDLPSCFLIAATFVFTSSEAIDAIVSFSTTSEALLKRKKITKDILVKYMYSKNLPVDDIKDLSKDDIIVKILIHWMIQVSVSGIECHDNI